MWLDGSRLRICDTSSEDLTSLKGHDWFAKAGHSFQGRGDADVPPGEGGDESIAEAAEKSVDVEEDESSTSWLWSDCENGQEIASLELKEESEFHLDEDVESQSPNFSTSSAEEEFTFFTEKGQPTDGAADFNKSLSFMTVIVFE